MKIPYLDLHAHNRRLAPELLPVMQAVLATGPYIGGPWLAQFEADFAAYAQAPYCIGCGNGLDAIRLALMALDLGPADEVIVPAHTYIATWLPVTQLGARLVPADPEPGQFLLSAASIAPHITPRTKAIIVVHLYGIPCDMPAICALAQQHGIPIIADAAQAHGARWHGHAIGHFSDFTAWSFYPGKNLGALGDAGAVTTRHRHWADKIRALGNYGSSRKYHNDWLGINSRLDPLQAAILSVKLRHLPDWNAARQRIAQHYRQALADLPELQLPAVPADGEAVWHCFVLRSARRDALQQHLHAHGIETLIHYPVAPHRQAAYAATPLAQCALPEAEALAASVLSLPIDPDLSSAQVATICHHIRQFFLQP